MFVESTKTSGRQLIRYLGVPSLMVLSVSGFLFLLAYSNSPLLESSPAAATEPTSQTGVLAVVNGEPITEQDFDEALQAMHQGRSVQSVMSMDFHKLLEGLIEERLIIQEAERMNLDQEADVLARLELEQKVAAAEELVRREVKEPVEINDEMIEAYFNDTLQEIRARQILVETLEEAEAVLEELKSGADFAELARERSIGSRASSGGDLGTFPIHKIYPPLEDEVLALQVGETSQPISAPDGFHIVKLGERTPADPELLPTYREKVKTRLRHKLERERYKALIAKLRAESDITIFKDVLEGITREDVLKGSPKKSEEVVAEVKETKIPFTFFRAEMARRMRQSAVSEEKFPKVRDQVLNILIDQILLRKEAERRGLTEDPQVVQRVEKVRERILKKKFLRLAILPQIDSSDEKLRNYYMENQESYSRPGSVQLARLVVSSEDKALALWERLKNGTDFSWLVKRESEDSEEIVKKGGELPWSYLPMLPGPIKNAVEDLPIGGISKPVKSDSTFQIFYVKNKSQGGVRPFETVKNQVKRDYVRERIESIRTQLAIKLKEVSIIMVDEKRFRKYYDRITGDIDE